MIRWQQKQRLITRARLTVARLSCKLGRSKAGEQEKQPFLLKFDKQGTAVFCFGNGCFFVWEMNRFYYHLLD
jgi:hypothetical protein